jgi:phage shock protein PspC (stress-responsive transcriptional regulator)
MASDIKKLYRSRNDRMIAGVCGGLGEYFSIDPTLFRLVFVIAAVFGGSGILAYLLFMIIVPQEPMEVADSPIEVTETEPQEGETD